MTRSFAALLLVTVTVGCANVEVRPIKKDADGKIVDVEGVRFYRPWPYLWVKPTDEKDKTGCQAEIVYLPDMNQEYIIIPHTGIGSITMAPTLSQGWSLTVLNATADSKASDMITSIGGLVGNIKPTFKAPDRAPDRTPDDQRRPGLYAFRFGKDGKVDGLYPASFLHDGQCYPS